MQYSSAAKLPTCATSISDGATPVDSRAPSVAPRIMARMDLPSLDQLRAKSVCSPPSTKTGTRDIPAPPPTAASGRDEESPDVADPADPLPVRQTRQAERRPEPL